MSKCWACFGSGIIKLKHHDDKFNLNYDVCYRCSCNTRYRELSIPTLASGVEEKIAENNKKNYEEKRQIC